MKFGETLRKIRKSKKMTQEDLAEFLNVSPQAVSKWERGDNYPDVTLIPRIAAFFDVSIDELFGIVELNEEKEIRMIHSQWEKNNCAGNHKENVALLKQAIKTFPKAYDLLGDLITSLVKIADEEKESKYYFEAIKIAERILKYCPDYDICNAIHANICHIYKKAGNSEEAIEEAEKLPRLTKSKEITMLLIQEGEEQARTAQDVLVFAGWSIYYSIMKLVSGDHYTVAEKLELLDRSTAAIDALCPEPFSKTTRRKFDNEMKKIHLLLSEDQYAEAVLCTERAFVYAKEKEQCGNAAQPFIFNLWGDGERGYEGTEEPACVNILLDALENDSAFEPISNDPAVLQIKREIMEMLP